MTAKIILRIRGISWPFKLQCLCNYNKKLPAEGVALQSWTNRENQAVEQKEKKDFFINMFNKVNLMVFFNKNYRWSNQPGKTVERWSSRSCIVSLKLFELKACLHSAVYKFFLCVKVRRRAQHAWLTPGSRCVNHSAHKCLTANKGFRVYITF